MKKVLIIVGSILVLIAALTTTIVVKRNQKINEYRQRILNHIKVGELAMDSLAYEGIAEMAAQPRGEFERAVWWGVAYNQMIFDRYQHINRMIDFEVAGAKSEGLSFEEVVTDFPDPKHAYDILRPAMDSIREAKFNEALEDIYK